LERFVTHSRLSAARACLLFASNYLSVVPARFVLTAAMDFTNTLL